MGEVRTRELGLASFLILSGYDPVRMEMVGDRTAEWVFESDETGIRDLMSEYRCGDSEVEPKDFIRTLSRTRRDMYTFVREHGASS